MAGSLKILVVDDELPARNRLKEILQDVSETVSLSVVAEASDGLKAITLLNDTAVDIVLLDIRMPGMDGIEVARHAQNLARPPAVIFTTAFDAYAVKAFELNAVDYLLKPIRRERLQAALEKARGRMGGGATRFGTTAAQGARPLERVRARQDPIGAAGRHCFSAR